MTSRMRLAVWLTIDVVVIGLLARVGPRPLALREALADPQGWVDQVGPDVAAVVACSLACWAMLLWVTVGLLLVASSAAPGAIGCVADAFAGRLVPAAVRRAVTVALGISVGTVAVGSAAAADSTPARITHLTRPAIALSGSQDHWPLGAASAPPGVDWPLDPAPAESPQNRGTPSTTPSAGQKGRGESTAVDRRRTKHSPDASGTAGGQPTAAGSTPRRPIPETRAERTGNGPSLVPSPTTSGTHPATAAPVGEPVDAGAVAGPVLVRAGDCLWLIAARRLGPRAGAAEIAREWPRWYALNRQVIGDDPDVIRPGQALVAPPGRASSAAFPTRRSR
jgi:hypothetical protein